MLDKQHDNFTIGTLDGDGNFIGTVEAKIDHLKSMVHNLAPNSSSGSSANIASGKTDIMKYKKIEDALGKVTHVLTDSTGKSHTRQTRLSPHDKDHMERILKFIGKELSEGEDTDDPRYGTFENAIGDIIHILKLKEEVGSKSSEEQKYATIIKKHRKFEESSGIPLSTFQKFGVLNHNYTEEEFQQLEGFMPKHATKKHLQGIRSYFSKKQFLEGVLDEATIAQNVYNAAVSSGKSKIWSRFKQDAEVMDLF